METEDPVIQRIRDTRARFQAECDNDPEKMYLRLVEEQKKHADRLVFWEHPDEILAVHSAAADQPKT